MRYYNTRTKFSFNKNESYFNCFASLILRLKIKLCIVNLLMCFHSNLSMRFIVETLKTSESILDLNMLFFLQCDPLHCLIMSHGQTKCPTSGNTASTYDFDGFRS